MQRLSIATRMYAWKDSWFIFTFPCWEIRGSCRKEFEDLISYETRKPVLNFVELSTSIQIIFGFKNLNSNFNFKLNVSTDVFLFMPNVSKSVMRKGQVCLQNNRLLLWLDSAHEQHCEVRKSSEFSWFEIQDRFENILHDKRFLSFALH